AAHAAASDRTRVATIRTGIVLAKEGGALAKLTPLYRFGLGGRMGSGRQWQSWIALEDEVGAIVHLLSTPAERDSSGAVNLTAPEPVTQREFAATLARVMHRPAFVPVPKFEPKLLLGREKADALVFTGQRVLPKALEASGFEFRFTSLEAALRAILA